MPTKDIVARAEQIRRTGSAHAAVRACKTLIVFRPNHAEALFQRAAAVFSQGQVRSASAAFERVRLVLPGASAVHFNIGVCARRLDAHATAEQPLRRALVLDPAARGATDALAQSLVTLARTDAAARLMHRLRCLAPFDADCLATIGFVAWKSGRLALAIDALRRSLVIQPSGHGADCNLANTLFAMGQYDAAIGRYRRLLTIHPTDWSTIGNLGVALIETGDWRAAAEVYRGFARLTRGRPLNQADDDPRPDLPGEPIVPISRTTAWHQLSFNRDQLRYLMSRDRLPGGFSKVVEAYERILKGLDDQQKTAISFPLNDRDFQSVSAVHGRMIHLRATNWGNERALNPRIDWPATQSTYRRATPAIAVIDEFLTAEALRALRRFCLESTIWFQLKGAGYLGAYFREGFNDPLLLKIADELMVGMPEVFAGHPLRMMWAYSYEQSMVGINPHADFAGVNVNFWITPDDANLDPETGGLLVYNRPAPKEWGFEQYNAAPGSEVMAYLGEDAKHPTRIPHRQNRAVVFDSRLFHETDQLRFRPGFENRRINVTMLFGQQ